MALENGLIVPVIRAADEKNVLGLQRSIVDLAHNLSLKVVAEGIEALTRARSARAPGAAGERGPAP